MPRKMLIVEDEENIAELIELYMQREGFETQIASDGEQAIEKFRVFRPDIVMLDVMLPKLDGWGVLSEIRSEGKTPVIMLTAKGELSDRVSGLNAGADDYIVKPFEMKEVIARVSAVMRRSGSEPDKPKRLVFDNLIIDMERFELIVNGKRIDTPPKELELLAFLAGNPNRVYTRDQLLDEVWGFDYYGDSRTVDVHIKRLREKIEGASEHWELKTVWGVGYRFDTDA